MSLMGHCSYGGVREFKWIASSSFGIDGMEEQNLSSEYEMLAFTRWKLCQFFSVASLQAAEGCKRQNQCGSGNAVDTGFLVMSALCLPNAWPELCEF